MFRVKSGPREYALVFSIATVTRLTEAGVELTEQTRCLVHGYFAGEQDPEHDISGIGFAYRAPGDKPNEWIGRMWAVERAVANFPSLDRMDILDAFWRARLKDEALEAAFEEAERANELAQEKAAFMQHYQNAEACKARVIQLLAEAS